MPSRTPIRLMAVVVCLLLTATVTQAQAVKRPDIQAFFNFERVGGPFHLGVQIAAPFDDAILLGSGQGLVRSTDEGHSWVHVLSPLKRKDIIAIAVHENDIVVGSANGGIYRSTDRGLYWDRFSNEPGVVSIASLLRVTEGYLAVNSAGACYKKSDQSVEWLPIPMPSPCMDVAIFRNRTWFVCQNGVLLEDDGKGLKERNAIQVTDRVSLVATNDFLAVVLDSIVVVLDEDGDSVAAWPLPFMNWSACAEFEDQLLIGGRGTGLKRINLETGYTTFAFAGPAENENISALAVSHDTIVVGTTQGAGRCYVIPQSTMQWHSLNPFGSVSTFDATAIAYDKGVVYVAASGEGVHSGKAKESFITPIHEVYDQAMITQLEQLRDEMVVVGRRTGIWRLKKGGGRLAWFSNTLPFSFDYFACVVGRHVVVGLTEGRIVWSDDDGVTWEQSIDTLPQINQLSSVGEWAYASTFKGVYRSADAGKTWQLMTGPWDSKNVLWVTGVADTLIVTTTLGSYLSINNNPAQIIQADSTQIPPVPFASVQLYRGILFATGLLGVYASADGGATWEKKFLDRSRAAIAQFFYHDYYYVFNNEGDLWRSPIPR